MEWWIGWVIAALLGLPAAIYYSLRIKSRLEQGKQQRRSAKAEIKTTVIDSINKAKDYRRLGVKQLEELIEDRRTPAKSRKKLIELVELGKEYDNWLYESWQLVNNEIQRNIFETPGLRDLDDSITHSHSIGKSLTIILRGEEGTAAEQIYKAIYIGNLTFEHLRNAVLEKRREAQITLEGETLTLREAVERESFQRLFNTLGKLDTREPIKKLRDVQNRFIVKEKAFVTEVS